MGHAYKLLLIFENGAHEVLHYTTQSPADEAFEALKEFPTKINFLKLYKPLERYRTKFSKFEP